MSQPVNEPAIYLDADACPVKETIYKVSGRYDVPVFVVANSPMRMPPSSAVRARLIVVPGAFDAADDWIAERATVGDLVLTADIPLASRTVSAGVKTLDFRGREFSSASIGNALASREINAYLRGHGRVRRRSCPVQSERPWEVRVTVGQRRQHDGSPA